MNNDLISRSALKEIFLQDRCGDSFLPKHYVISIIDNAPTVKKRPQGKWIKEGKLWGGFGDTVLVNTCSECGESFIYHGNNPKFCSECGADMRGEENDK